jgi:hypothetical protein
VRVKRWQRSANTASALVIAALLLASMMLLAPNAVAQGEPKLQAC